MLMLMLMLMLVSSVIMETPTSFQIISLLPLYFSFFLFIYLLAFFIVFRNWSPDVRPEASSCLISLFHGTPAVFLAVNAIFSDSNWGFSSPNTVAQNSVLDFSIAYFLTDLLHYIVFYPRDVLFIGHHLATLFVFVTCRYFVFHGAFSILVLLILAEVTSFCQNAWTLANARRGDVKFAAKLYDLLSPPFYAFYTLVRGFAGPYFVFRMGEFFITNGEEAERLIPRWIWVSWMIVVVMAISVSLLWISNLWVVLYTERRLKSQRKLK